MLNINHYFLEFLKKQFILILFNVLDQNYHTFLELKIKKINGATLPQLERPRLEPRLVIVSKLNSNMY